MRQATVAAREVRIEAGPATLPGTLHLPEGAGGIVLFAHGSGSSRHSPRNQSVARQIQEVGVGTLLFDLLGPEEEEADRIDAHIRFDIPFLARRLLHATAWVRQQEELRTLRVGLFGSSTGGAAALVAAAEDPDRVDAVVSRGGRPDLAGGALPGVRCPVLLIVGGDDTQVLRLNEQARDQMSTNVELRVIPGATHLFEEPGKLEEVAEMAAAFFARRLAGPA